MKAGEDWVFEAATAVAPVIVLGQYKKLIKAGNEKYAKKLAETKDAKENEDELLQSIFITMIESIKPKVAPILLQEEMNQQLELLNQQLGEHKIQLADYIKSQGRTEEQFKQDLAALSLGAIQLEFVLQEVTKDLNVTVGEEDVNGWLKEQKYPDDTKLPEDLKQRLLASMQRRKTTEEILKIAREK
jgi:FKBP-type peptidyl-prolyl cis-trans isomerase (trigger factor)